MVELAVGDFSTALSTVPTMASNLDTHASTGEGEEEGRKKRKAAGGSTTLTCSLPVCMVPD
jgi:hypothetical protein